MLILRPSLWIVAFIFGVLHPAVSASRENPISSVFMPKGATEADNFEVYLLNQRILKGRWDPSLELPIPLPANSPITLIQGEHRWQLTTSPCKSKVLAFYLTCLNTEGALKTLDIPLAKKAVLGIIFWVFILMFIQGSAKTRRAMFCALAILFFIPPYTHKIVVQEEEGIFVIEAGESVPYLNTGLQSYSIFPWQGSNQLVFEPNCNCQHRDAHYDGCHRVDRLWESLHQILLTRE